MGAGHEHGGRRYCRRHVQDWRSGTTRDCEAADPARAYARRGRRIKSPHRSNHNEFFDANVGKGKQSEQAMRRPATVAALEKLGRVRLSHSFYMREFLYSEI